MPTLDCARRTRGDKQEHSLEDVRERFDLFLRHEVEEVAMDVLGMPGRSAFDGAPPGFGESHHGAATVLHALLARDEAAPLHPGDVVREAAPVPTDLGAELTCAEHGAGLATLGAYLMTRTVGVLGLQDDQAVSEAVIAVVAELLALGSLGSWLAGELWTRDGRAGRPIRSRLPRATRPAGEGRARIFNTPVWMTR